jgi:hypothetical protein
MRWTDDLCVVRENGRDRARPSNPYGFFGGAEVFGAGGAAGATD